MKYLIILFAVLLHLPVSAHPYDSLNRKSDIEECTEHIYSIDEFQRVADSMQMTISELCDYPVIFPIKEPERISSGFGMRYHPVYKRRKFHTGIDIPKTKGTPVYASGNGIVVRKGYCSGYGNYIEIQHAGGFRSFYAHLSKTIVSIGDSVNIATQIACVGNTGISTGCHLHYEIRKGKRFLNPIGWCCCLLEILKNNTKQNQYEFS
ncbi:MAG: M23 family metallopeptidase [Massilibacteroides sp.]|nr:M23 family metallopeptidase [Massilibacteroides sp.]